MTPEDAYRTLEAQERRMSVIGGALAVLHWDRAVMMPDGGLWVRAEQTAALNVVLHEMRTDPRRADLIEKAEAGASGLDEWRRANLREIRRFFERATALSADLVERLAHARAETEMAWRGAKQRADFSAVSDQLANLLALVREEAEMLGSALKISPYDALLDGYDWGLRAAQFQPLFDRLAGDIPPLLDGILARMSGLAARIPLSGPFPVAAQERLGRTVMQRLGFDFDHGRLDVSHHPFTGGVPEDTRITTRYEEGDFIQALMAVIHETGHALYERGLPQAWRNQPVGRARGMVLHESQSLMFEMQAGRSPAFVSYLSRLAREVFGGSGPAWASGNLLRHYHKVERGLIRVHADEVSYPLHVIARTRLEQAMIAGALKVADLPEAWNAAVTELMGVTPANDRDGCLQDIHWYSGAFGYFPTYTLGALAAAQLFRAALAAAPEIEAELARGRADALLKWVRAKVHCLGSLALTDEVIEQASGARLGVAAFLDHLRARYLGGGTLAGAAAAQ
ncbi:MAG: carboxypeptidase M32 [Hyphomicrobiales bacterium]|nr:carboxypeptidase M32 [Hyphomicrobiales bacterium]